MRSEEPAENGSSCGSWAASNRKLFWIKGKKKGKNTRGAQRVTEEMSNWDSERTWCRQGHLGALKDLLREADITITYSLITEDLVLLLPGCPSWRREADSGLGACLPVGEKGGAQWLTAHQNPKEWGRGSLPPHTPRKRTGSHGWPGKTKRHLLDSLGEGSVPVTETSSDNGLKEIKVDFSGVSKPRGKQFRLVPSSYLWSLRAQLLPRISI